jgi:HTH-type transcriptional regulator/antitoxin HigA
MAQIKNEAAYQAALRRVEQLEELVDDENAVMDDNAMELDMLVDMIEEYEDIHYPIGKPSLVDTIKLRLYEMNLTQSKLAEMIGVSPTRISDIMTGKCEPTLKLGREISKKLKISPDVVLGV